MKGQRRKFSAAFKAKVAIEALEEIVKSKKEGAS